MLPCAASVSRAALVRQLGTVQRAVMKGVHDKSFFLTCHDIWFHATRLNNDRLMFFLIYLAKIPNIQSHASN